MPTSPSRCRAARRRESPLAGRRGPRDGPRAGRGFSRPFCSGRSYARGRTLHATTFTGPTWACSPKPRTLGKRPTSRARGSGWRRPPAARGLPWRRCMPKSGALSWATRWRTSTTSGGSADTPPSSSPSSASATGGPRPVRRSTSKSTAWAPTSSPSRTGATPTSVWPKTQG